MSRRAPMLAAAVWLTASLLGGCDPAGYPHYLDAPPAPPGPGGVSNERFRAVIAITALTSAGTDPADSEVSVDLYDLGLDPVGGATVTATVDGTPPRPLGETDPGAYSLGVAGWPERVEVDIRKDYDFIEDVILDQLPVHSVTVDPASLAVGSTVHVGWEPNGETGVFVDLYVTSAAGTTFVDFGLPDTGDYQGSDPAFPSSGAYQVYVDRYRMIDVNSQDSIAYVDLYVVADVNVASALDGGLATDGP